MYLPCFFLSYTINNNDLCNAFCDHFIVWPIRNVLESHLIDRVKSRTTITN